MGAYAGVVEVAAVVLAETPDDTRFKIAIEREYGKPWFVVVGRLLYEERLTQDRVAKRLGVSRRTISMWSRDPRVRHKQTTA